MRSGKAYGPSNINFVINSCSSYSSEIKRILNDNESCRLKKNIGDTERVGKVKKTKIMNFNTSENLVKNFNKKSNQPIIKKKVKRRS